MKLTVIAHSIVGKIILHAEDLKGASGAYRGRIESENLGSSEIGEAKVFEDNIEDKKQIARISYNGRVWGMDGKEIAL